MSTGLGSLQLLLFSAMVFSIFELGREVEPLKRLEVRLVVLEERQPNRPGPHGRQLAALHENGHEAHPYGVGDLCLFL